MDEDEDREEEEELSLSPHSCLTVGGSSTRSHFLRRRRSRQSERTSGGDDSSERRSCAHTRHRRAVTRSRPSSHSDRRVSGDGDIARLPVEPFTAKHTFTDTQTDDHEARDPLFPD